MYLITLMSLGFVTGFGISLGFAFGLNYLEQVQTFYL